MISSTLHRLRSPKALLSQRAYVPVAAALAAVVLLAGCSGASAPAASSTSASTSASTPSSGSSSASPSPSPSTASPAPTGESAVKKLVDGFPSQLIPLMPGAVVASSSLQHSAPLAVASLTAAVTAPAADVLTYYTKVFTDQGFAAQPGDAVEGVPLKTFVRADGAEVVTVSVVQTDETATVTIGANVLPTSLK